MLKLLDNYNYECEICKKKTDMYHTIKNIKYTDENTKYVCMNCMKKELENSGKYYYLEYVPNMCGGGILQCGYLFNSSEEGIKFIENRYLHNNQIKFAYDIVKVVNKPDKVYALMKVKEAASSWFVLGYTNINLPKYYSFYKTYVNAPKDN